MSAGDVEPHAMVPQVARVPEWVWMWMWIGLALDRMSDGR